MFLGLAAKAQAATYYVDNCVVTGNDSNNGTGPATPWLTINKVNTSSFVVGDSISFRKGCTWREQLTVPSSGSAGNPITFGSYGASGANPIINGSDVLLAWTQSAYSNIVTNGGFDSTTNGWTEIGATLLTSEAGGQSGNSLKIQATDGSGQAAYQIITGLTNGATYDFSIYLKNGTTDGKLFIGSGVQYSNQYYNGSYAARADWTVVAGSFTTTGTQATVTIIEQGVNQNTYADSISIIRQGTMASYQKTITTEPKHVYYNSTALTEDVGATNNVGVNKWDWAANVLYVNVGEDPSVGTLEAGQRDGISTNGKNYITLDGLTISKANVNAITGGTASHVGVTITNSSIDNATYGVKFYTWGGTLSTISLITNTFSAISENLIDVNGEAGQTVTGLTIVGNTLTGDGAGTGSGMFLNGVTGGVNLVDGNTITNVGESGAWLHQWSGGTNTFSNNTISYWQMGTNDRGGFHLLGGTGGTYVFESNTLHDNGGTGQGSALYMDTISGSTVTVRYNYVYNTKGPGLGSIQSSGVIFYNNILVNTGLVGWGIRNSGSIEVETWNDVNAQNNLFYNNIVYNNTAANGAGIYLVKDSGAGTLAGNTFKNNIIWHDKNVGQEYVKNPDDSTAVFVNNLYWPAIGTNDMNWGGNWYSTLATWQTAGHDSGSINVNPVFVSAGSDFALQSTSPAIDTGTNLGSDYDDAIMPGSSWPSSVTTIDQDLRGSGWEIGAYVYPVPQAPTIGTPSALSPSSIRWAFTDNSNDETGFSIYDNNDNTVNSATPDGLSYLDETGLSCGTSYSGRYIKAYNSYGESVASAVASSQSTNICGEGVIVGIIGSRGGTLGMAAPVTPSQTTTSPSQIAQVPSAPPILIPFVFTLNLKLGMKGNDVKQLQIFLNQHLDVPLAKTGPGSPRNETDFFGPLTKAAVIRCQEQHAKEILAPWGLTKGTGFVGKTTRAKINELMMK